MTLTWISQGSDTAERCRRCRKIILAWNIFFRAAFDQDGADEFGYDVCFQCRKTLPATPPERDLLPTLPT